jgi:N4-gp56 family major capsid protein
MVANKKSITVDEWGNAIKVSEKLLRLSWDDVMAEAATLLGRDYAVVRDLAFRDALSSEITNIIYADAGATGGNSDKANMEAADVLDIETIRDAVEILETANAPKFFGDYYVCFVHPHQASHLRRDQDWVHTHQYVGTRNIFNGEIGRFEDVIFVTTTHALNGVAGANTPGESAFYQTGGDAGDISTIPLYEGLIFGDQCLYSADALPVELRDNGVEDFGRIHGLAWYSLFGVKCLCSEYGVKLVSA